MTVSVDKRKRRIRTKRSLGLIALLMLLVGDSAAIFMQVTPPPAVFQIELPELSVVPTDQPELTIPSTRVTQIQIHILKPQADEIEYSQIFPALNGEATGRIHEVAGSERGKLVRLHLTRWPGFELVPGRNTVEIRVQNRRGRSFYASFVLRTVTENRNSDFVYRVELGKDPKQQVPPELVLLEPEWEIVFQPGQKSRTVRIAGVATAATSVERVTVDGKLMALKRGRQVTVRKLGLANEENRATFDAAHTVAAQATQVTVEATDTDGNRAQLQIPVRTRDEKDQPLEFRGRKYALVIGISKFRYSTEGVTNLKYADVDARSIFEFLQTPGGGRFPRENILVLTNEQATLAEVRKALTDFVARPGPDDLLLIFFASHGNPDPSAPQNLYFIVHDTHLDRMAETGLAMKDFQMLVQRNVHARRLVLLVDTCHSAGLTGPRGEGFRALQNNLVSLYAEKFLYREEGTAIITSSDVNELSREDARWGGGHGVFTHFLLEAMRGRADANADRVVTVGEMFRYVRLKVRLETDFRQNPRILTGTNEDLTLAAVTALGELKLPTKTNGPLLMTRRSAGKQKTQRPRGRE